MKLILKKVRFIFIIAGLLIVSGCNQSLIYAEGTNVSLATIKVNDDVAEPLNINFGLDRSVAAIAPPKTIGDESVSMISDFRYEYKGGEFTGTLKIKTQFASGDAGIALVTNKPKAAAKMAGIKLKKK